jgi:hypothetical protein
MGMEKKECSMLGRESLCRVKKMYRWVYVAKTLQWEWKKRM